MVQAVHDERYSPGRVVAQGGRYRVRQRFLVGCKTRSLFVDKSGICFSETAEQAAEDRFAHHPGQPVTVGVAQVAVVLSNQPPAGCEPVHQLLARPRLSLPRRADSKQNSAFGGNGLCGLNEVADCASSRYFASPVHGMSACDCAEVMTQLCTTKELLRRDPEAALAGSPHRANQRFRHIDHRAVFVGVDTSAEFALNPVDEKLLSWPWTQEVRSHLGCRKLYQQMLTEPIKILLLYCRIPFV
ncbi:hypothetical protein DF19_08815 [Streptomyces olindensis]|nr:hypothetical protein DF19_18755 [Streptomyces olindensis]KDN77685.1 hypothetical protein DF19_08815 [Streptomyces olindensis]